MQVANPDLRYYEPFHGCYIIDNGTITYELLIFFSGRVVTKVTDKFVGRLGLFLPLDSITAMTMLDAINERGDSDGPSNKLLKELQDFLI